MRDNKAIMAKARAGLAERLKDPEFVRDMSERRRQGQIRRNQDPTQRALVRANLDKQRPLANRRRAELGICSVRDWSVRNRDLASEISRKTMTRLWSDPEFAKKVSDTARRGAAKLASRGQKTHLEIFFEKHCGFRVEYTGRGGLLVKFKTGKWKMPDFMIPGTKTVIELFGTYWHQGESEEELIKNYADVGYTAYVFWDTDIYPMFGASRHASPS